MSGCPASEGNIGSRMDTQAFQAQLVMVCIKDILDYVIYNAVCSAES
jgi:hypothetical protein